MKMNSNLINLICASEEEEFFYEDSDLPVNEGDPIGIDFDNGDKVDLILFKGIYWKPQY
jgi:hypothetical protein